MRLWCQKHISQNMQVIIKMTIIQLVSHAHICERNDDPAARPLDMGGHGMVQFSGLLADFRLANRGCNFECAAHKS